MDDDDIGKEVSATMNGKDWFDGVLVEVIDLFAPYRVRLDGGDIRAFVEIRDREMANANK